ncbi:MAG: hypothetical protein LBH57_03090, partial [Treponema sp.]|nr:hypothetical protein [Treponema sp.]
MKIVKPIGLLTASILTFLLVGCFNPISVVPPKNLADPFTEPFTVDVLIGKDTQARSIAGPSAERIREGIRNIYQLIVINDDGKIVAFDEVRRMKQDDNTATFRIESLGFGHDYHFLLLMGYWKWTGVDSKGVYKYDDAVPPTLLAAGLKTQMVTGSGTVTITMWPIVVDTVFTTTDLDVPSQKVTPEIIKKAGTDEIHPQTVELPPVDWKITWKVQRSDSAGDGFAELIKARNKMWGTVPQELFSGSKGLVWEDGVNKEEGNNLVFDTVNKNFITLDISKYTSGITKIGKKGSANFNLEYVPFNLEDAGKWKEADSKRKSNFGLDGKKLPVWIIRNGMNDDAQTDKTDFGTSRKPDSDFDWNGAVRFAVAAETPKNPDNPQSEDLVIKDGKFEGRVGGSNNAKIGFTTAGYTTGNATAYYAVVPLANNALPGYSAYKYLGKFAAKSHTGNVITLLDPPEDDYNIYVVLLKG